MPDPTPTPAPPAPAPTPAPNPEPPAPTPAPTPAPSGEPPLGEAGQRALAAEREARAVAEKEAKAQKRRADELERQGLTEKERLERDAAQGRALAATATQKLRQANLITALAGQGLTGPKAKAASKLLEGVQFDDFDEPTNLSDRLTAAKAIYGEEMFASATPAPPAPPPDPRHPHPDVHHGPRATPAPAADEDALMAAYLRQNFPHAAPAAPT